MNYREQVQRMAAMYHAKIELGLGKAREQEAWVKRLLARLQRQRIACTWRLNTDFDTEIRVSLDDLPLLKCMFAREPFAADTAQSWVLVSDAGEVRFILTEGEP